MFDWSGQAGGDQLAQPRRQCAGRRGEREDRDVGAERAVRSENAPAESRSAANISV
ncbi:hypothetical protein [Nonomuraea dietziae]|uniref:hypothetical protein n=1 Tax=Nonomuraea dietziae TaxID=65515 RepID=UPI00342E9776